MEQVSCGAVMRWHELAHLGGRAVPGRFSLQHRHELAAAVCSERRENIPVVYDR